MNLFCNSLSDEISQQRIKIKQEILSIKDIPQDIEEFMERLYEQRKANPIILSNIVKADVIQNDTRLSIKYHINFSGDKDLLYLKPSHSILPWHLSIQSCRVAKEYIEIEHTVDTRCDIQIQEKQIDAQNQQFHEYISQNIATQTREVESFNNHLKELIRDNLNIRFNDLKKASEAYIALMSNKQQSIASNVKEAKLIMDFAQIGSIATLDKIDKVVKYLQEKFDLAPPNAKVWIDTCALYPAIEWLDFDNVIKNLSSADVIQIHLQEKHKGLNYITREVYEISKTPSFNAYTQELKNEIHTRKNPEPKRIESKKDIVNTETTIKDLLIFMKDKIESVGALPEKHPFSLYNSFKTPEPISIEGVAILHWTAWTDSKVIPSGQDFITFTREYNIDVENLDKAINICKTREYIKQSFCSIAPEPILYLTKIGYKKALEYSAMTKERTETVELVKIENVREEIEEGIQETKYQLPTKTKLRNRCKALIKIKIPEYLKLEQFKSGGFKNELREEVRLVIEKEYPVCKNKETLFTAHLFNEQWRSIIKENPEYSFLSKQGRRYDKETQN